MKEDQPRAVWVTDIVKYMKGLSHVEKVRQFMVEVAGQNCPDKPTKFDNDTLRLRLRLINEEFEELLSAASVTPHDVKDIACRSPQMKPKNGV